MQGFAFSRGSNGPAGMTSVNLTLNSNQSTPVSLAQPSNQIKVSNYSSFLLYINFAGPATPFNYGIPPGQTFQYDGQAVSGFQLNSNGQTINYGVFAS